MHVNILNEIFSMPLERGSSREVIDRNLSLLLGEGYEKKQALAIAFKTAGQRKDTKTMAKRKKKRKSTKRKGTHHTKKRKTTKRKKARKRKKKGWSATKTASYKREKRALINKYNRL
jgi:hypothetical protein